VGFAPSNKSVSLIVNTIVDCFLFVLESFKVFIVKFVVERVDCLFEVGQTARLVNLVHNFFLYLFDLALKGTEILRNFCLDRFLDLFGL